MQSSQTHQVGKTGHFGTWFTHVFANDANRILALLLFVDLTFIIIHIWWWTTLVTTRVEYNPNFSITHEGGFSERYQFAKEFWIVLLCGLIAIRQRTWTFGVWALLFSYILYDDSRAVHEHKGGEIVAYIPDLPFPGGISAQDIGELTVFLIIGLTFLPLFALAYWRSAPPLRTIHRRLLLFVIILAGLAAGADLIHRLYPPYWWDILWGVTEDGGELVIMSVIFWYVFKLSGQRNAAIHTHQY